jgi:hypothetical protein
MEDRITGSKSYDRATRIIAASKRAADAREAASYFASNVSARR